jgi:hypothetical protein
LADLRRAPLADVRAVGMRAPERDLWADEAALWDRFEAAWAGLDDAAWHVPGAAPSDAGGPDWSLAEHVGHVTDWQELAIDYTARAIETGEWPGGEDFDNGDFDRFNEGRREPWASMSRDAILARLSAARPRLLALAQRLPAGEFRGDAGWGWIHMTLGGHYLDHLAVIEPWADALRRRQTDGDPFVADARPANHAGFVAQDAAIARDFDRLVRPVAAKLWTTTELTPGWTLRDHIAHLADWLEEGSRALEIHERTGEWLADPEEGVDAWNDRMVARSRRASPAEVLARYDAARRQFHDRVARLSTEDLRSADGWSWAFDCLHGHDRKHLAMIGPWCAALGWPAGER